MNKIWIKLLQAILPTVVQHIADLLVALEEHDDPPTPVKLGRPPKSKPATSSTPADPLIK